MMKMLCSRNVIREDLPYEHSLFKNNNLSIKYTKIA